MGRSVFLPLDFWMYSVPFSISGADANSHLPRNPLLSDAAYLYPPPLRIVHDALRDGSFPLWNRFLRGGEPMLGTGESGPLDPLNLPILLMPWPLGFAWAAWLRFGLMWAGAYLYARALRLDRGWSTAVAVGFCFAPGFIVHFEQLPRAISHLGLPWLLWLIERLVAALPEGRRAIVRAALPIAFVEFLMALSGYPPAAFNVSFGAAVYLLLRLPWRPGRDALWARLAGLSAFALGGMMAAAGLVPLVEFLLASETLVAGSEVGQWTLPAEVYRLYWNPLALGSPLTGVSPEWSGALNFEEEQQYVGLLPWVFLLASGLVLRRLARPDRRAFVTLAGTALFAAALAYGWPPLHGFFTSFPPFSSNSNPRLLILPHTFAIVLAALAARSWLEGERDRHAVVFSILAASTALGALVVLALGLREQWELRPWFVLAAAAALFAAGRFAATTAERRLASALVPILLLIDLAPVYKDYHPQSPRAWASEERALANLPPALQGQQNLRIAFERFTAPNLPALFGVEDVRGYGFPVPYRYNAYLYDVLDVENSETLFRADLERPAVIAGIERTCAAWLMTAVESAQHEPGRLEEIWRRGPLRIHRLQRASPCSAWYPTAEVDAVETLSTAVAQLRASLGDAAERILIEPATGARAATRAPNPGTPAPMRWANPNRLEIEIPAAARDRDGWLVLRVSWDSGWHAESGDGRPLEVAPAQVRFLAVATPAGTERVVLRYWPPHFGVWLALSASGFLAAGVAWRLGRGGLPRAW